MVRRNVELEARLIDDLLDVSRIAQGKLELRRSPVELCTVIRQTTEVCRADIEARGLHFSLDFGPFTPYWVEADVPRLQQVFWNVLKNAIKFTPHGGRVRIRCQPDAKHVVVDVHDSGIGIEPEALSRVFNAFEQVEQSITRQFGGLGLGVGDQQGPGGDARWQRTPAHSEGKGRRGRMFRIPLPAVWCLLPNLPTRRAAVAPAACRSPLAHPARRRPRRHGKDDAGWY